MEYQKKSEETEHGALLWAREKKRAMVTSIQQRVCVVIVLVTGALCVFRWWLHHLDGLVALEWADGWLCRLEGLSPRVPKGIFYCTADVPWCAALRRHWRTVRDEYRACLEREDRLAVAPVFGDVMPEQRILSAWGETPARWRVVILRLAGADSRHMAMFPVTQRLLPAGCSMVMFSILEGGRRLVPHTGVNHAVLRYHLALEVPDDGDCVLTVDGIARRWVAGQDLLFDDTLRHSAENGSPSHDRVVLFLDVPRPLQSWAARALRHVVHNHVLPRHPAQGIIGIFAQSTTLNCCLTPPRGASSTPSTMGSTVCLCIEPLGLREDERPRILGWQNRDSTKLSFFGVRGRQSAPSVT
jgi:beta-hydroxylase